MTDHADTDCARSNDPLDGSRLRVDHLHSCRVHDVSIPDKVLAPTGPCRFRSVSPSTPRGLTSRPLEWGPNGAIS